MISVGGRAILPFSFESSAKNVFDVVTTLWIVLDGTPWREMIRKPISMHACATCSTTRLRAVASPFLKGEISMTGIVLRGIVALLQTGLARVQTFASQSARGIPATANYPLQLAVSARAARCQISRAYSATVRSLENRPMRATLSIALRVQSAGCSYSPDISC